jgi:hypothetical protein
MTIRQALRLRTTLDLNRPLPFTRVHIVIAARQQHRDVLNCDLLVALSCLVTVRRCAIVPKRHSSELSLLVFSALSCPVASFLYA